MTLANSVPVSELQQRRQALAKAMAPNSVAIIPAAQEQVRSNDTHYPFRQNSDYYYYTGLNEPGGLLVLLPGKANESLLWVLNRDPEQEIWHGRRLGCEQAQALSGVAQCYSLNTLQEQLALCIDGCDELYIAQGMQSWVTATLEDVLRQLRANKRKGQRAPQRVHDLTPFMHNQRLIKSKYEQACMRQACKISVDAHRRAMRATEPGRYEFQIAAELHHEMHWQGAAGPAYGSIVGGGENACILHYTENTSELRDGDLLLIDAGAEFLGYAGDITRTFPVNGKFSEPQRKLYNLVLRAQEAAFAVIKPGATLPDAYKASVQVLVEGMVKLGILQGEVEQLIADMAFRPYFMHGLGHWLGLDVHDVGDYQVAGKPRPLEPGMVITVEPGLYIPANADCPEAYRGMGIRIEDDLLITESGFDNLTSGVPKTIEGIEALMSRGNK
ncbi:Xaa-Pro aminopeptidase [Aliidiomarina celeris]|uniref:Xaa-Pro aminopeptidase n=1 Tax=Aliidiomarina celeris TaxID=2249428 RepID=UPI000DE81E2A|nr:Xaa-Pro aminopeptidase [Aliidiomarina celeris]